MKSLFSQSLGEALDVIKSLAGMEARMAEAAQAVADCLKGGGKLLVCGNGGSAADSAHLATEFTCRFQSDRRPYPAIALTVDGSLLTAVSNDYSFNDVFARQVWAFGKPGDVLLAFTTSGKSRNILSAIEEARRRKLVTVAFLGKGGGFVAGAADIEFLVESMVTARVQEAHKFLLHALCEAVEAVLPQG